MTRLERIDAIIKNWELDVASLKNWVSWEDLHEKAEARRQQMLSSLLSALEPEREGLECILAGFEIDE